MRPLATWILAAGLAVPALAPGVGPVVGQLRAQEPSPGPALHPLEQVVAIVGNDVILQSSIERRVYGALRAVGTGTPPSEGEIKRVRAIALREAVRGSMLAQTAPILGAYDPEQLNRHLDHAVEQLEQELVEDLGSYSRFVQVLHDNNRSWDEIANEERQKQLRAFADAQVAVGLQLAQGRGHLLFTPQEMLQYYRDNPQMFAAEARTDLAAVAFADAAAAEAAADAWREQGDGASAEAIETAHGGVLHEVYAGPDGGSEGGFVGAAPGQPAPERDSRAGFLWDAAETLETGEVAVRQVGRYIWVLRVLARVDAENRPFQDRSVQRQIRDALLTQFHLNLTETAFRRSQQRIQLWSPELGRL